MIIKEKSKHYIMYAKNILIPSKRGGNNTVYQRTVAVSIWVVSSLVAVAVVLEAIPHENHWLIFFQNLSIGIACSGTVVIITAYLQFKSEEADKADEMSCKLGTLMLSISLRIDNPNEKISLDCVGESKLYKRLKEYHNISFSLLFYNPTKEKAYFSLLKAMKPIELAIEKGHLDNSTPRCVITIQEYKNALYAAETIFKDNIGSYFFEELITRFDTIAQGELQSEVTTGK